MRRSDREITDRTEIDEIVAGSEVCHLAMAVGGEPYVVPISFGYDGEAVYLHTAKRGKKLGFFAANPRVCVQFERRIRLVRSETDACDWTQEYESVIGYGFVEELLDPAAKAHGLNQIMRHYSGSEWTFTSPVFENTRVWRVALDELTGKRSKRKARSDRVR